MKTLEITLDDETAANLEGFLEAHGGDQSEALRSLLSNMSSMETVAAAAEARVGEAALREMLQRADEDFAAGRSITLEELEERYAD